MNTHFNLFSISFLLTLKNDTKGVFRYRKNHETVSNKIQSAEKQVPNENHNLIRGRWYTAMFSRFQ